MVENYTEDMKESVYHGAVVSVLAVGYTMLGKTLIKTSPPSLSKFDIEEGVKLVGIIALSDFTKNQNSDILQHSQNRPTGDRWLKF